MDLNIEAIVSKQDGNYALKPAIEEVLKNQTRVLSYSINKLWQKHLQFEKHKIKLSPRETETLKEIHNYLPYKKIAKKFGVKLSTV